MEIRDLLKSEFESRCQKNARYSLRAFARFLELDPPTLSKIFNNQKVPGLRLTNRLANKLGVSPDDRERLLRVGVGLEDIKEPKSGEYQRLENDQFNIISHWYYYAILEVLELKDAQHNQEWIAKRLDVSLNTAKTALERMERTGLIKRQNGKWLDTTDGKTTALGKELTSSARRQHQKEILEKAISALEETPVELRDQTSMTVSINVEDIPKVREFITEFRRKTSRFLNQAKHKDDVYNLSISFYPVTKSRGNKS